MARERGGKPFTKTSLHKLLTNITFMGKVRYKDEIHNGEHSAIVPAEIWQRVQVVLQRNCRTGGAAVRNKFGALLKGILQCVPCGCAMTPSHSTKNGTKRYRYYVCTSAQKRGWNSCPSKSIPAAEIERFVVDQIKRIGKDQALLDEILVQARRQSQALRTQLDTEREGLDRELAHWHGEIRKLVDHFAPGDGPATARLADLQERIRVAQLRAIEIGEQTRLLSRTQVDECEVVKAMAMFDPVWESLTLREQCRVVQLLVERVDYDGANDKVSITFHPTGIKTLAHELANQNVEDAA